MISRPLSNCSDILISDHESIAVKSILKIRLVTGIFISWLKLFNLPSKGDSSQSQDSPALGSGKKSSSLKNINGMHIQFSFGQEEKAIMLICYASNKKQSAEWLRALKKVW